jgi:transcriptional regulator with XRE-family HTH domain
MTSVLVTQQCFPKTGRKASAIFFPQSGTVLHNNQGVTDEALMRVFVANLRRLMDAHPALGSGPKLEARAGVGKSSISRWLANPPESVPTLDSIAAIARAFGVRPWELLLDDDESPREIAERLFGRR